MIKFEYSIPSEDKVEGKIHIYVDSESHKYFNEKQFPLRLIHKNLMGGIEWHSDLYSNHFSQFFMNTYTTVELIDSLGNKLFEWVWDPFIHGDFAHQYFEIWSLNNIGSNGIAIGTHNGFTGEWVGPVNKGRLKATLVEASEPQFNQLVKYYSGRTWVNLVQSLITTDGKDVVFYEGGDGQVNSISKETIEKHLPPDSITPSVKSSKSINDLIIESSESGPIKWIHIDVEGMDGELIYAIREDLLPDLLLFESLHLEEDYYMNLCNYLRERKYSITKSGWNTICSR